MRVPVAPPIQLSTRPESGTAVGGPDRVSVVIPARTEASRIAVLAQASRRVDLEIIVVDELSMVAAD